MGPLTGNAIKEFQRDADIAVNGEPTSELAFIIGATVGSVIADEDKPGSIATSATGTGFLVAPGALVTNAHVVENCRSVSVNASIAELLAVDMQSDLALLSVPEPTSGGAALKLRSGRGLRLADDVLVAGYPLSDILASGLSVTTGGVSSLSGLNGDRRHFQITAPVQPGNSGGPVLDEFGNVVGVVVSKLNAIAVAQQTGDIPQNINFAISLGTLQSFLDSHAVDYSVAGQSTPLSRRVVAEKATAATVQVTCN